MNKTDLLDRFARDGESRLLLARILDQQQRAQQRSIPTHTGFLSPAQQAESADLLMAAAPGQGLLHGGYPDAERKLWAFLPDWLEEEVWLAGEDCPLCEPAEGPDYEALYQRLMAAQAEEAAGADAPDGSADDGESGEAAEEEDGGDD